MCIKEFFGYACGHCSPPTLVVCPLTSQDPAFLPCPIAAERSIPAPGQFCPGCTRALWNKEVLDRENEHRVLHELGQCSYQQCGTAFTDEERKRGHSASTLATTGNVAMMRAVKQTVDESINKPPRVSQFHGMVVDYVGDDKSESIPQYIPIRQDNRDWPQSMAGFVKQSHSPQHSHDFGAQGGQSFPGNHSPDGGNPELGLHLYQPRFPSGEVHDQYPAQEFASRNRYPNHRGNRRRNRNHHNRGGFNNSRGSAEVGRYQQHGAHRQHKPNFSGSGQLLSPPNSASRVFQTTTGSYISPVAFTSPNYAKSSTSKVTTPTMPQSPLSTPDRLLAIPPGHFPAYDPERSSYPIPEVLRAGSPLPPALLQNEQMIEAQRSRAQSLVRPRKNAVTDIPSEDAISELVAAVEQGLHVSPSETSSHSDAPLDTPAESITPSLMGSPIFNVHSASSDDFEHVDEEELAGSMLRRRSSSATLTSFTETVQGLSSNDTH